MSNIEWVLFDLGGVLLEVHQPRIFHHLERLTGAKASSLEAQILAAPFFRDDLMIKEFSPSEMAQHVNQTLGLNLAEGEIIDAINAELGAEISSTAGLLPDLRRRVKVGCLSNTNSIHWECLLSSYDFIHCFDRRFASQILGCAKPGREIYDRVVDNLGVQPSSILFFDDKPENVQAAQRLGWHARVYTDHANLMSDLAAFGVVVSKLGADTAVQTPQQNK